MSVSYGGDKITFDDGTSIASGLSHFRNRVINGDMRIDQRNAGASVNLSITPQYIVDRWEARLGTSTGSVGQRSTIVPTGFGFTNSFLLSIGTGASPASNSGANYYNQKFEGLNVADLDWGTANAKTITISFWVRSSLTGSFGVCVCNDAISVSYPTSYTINSANTWEYKTITVPGSTFGGFATNNTGSVRLFFDWGNGSDFKGPANVWAAADYRGGASGTTNICATSGATWYITGVQLEVGSFATTFERRPYGTELALCQRYFLKTNPDNSSRCGGMWGSMYTSTTGHITGSLPVAMRIAPTATRGGTNDTFYISNVSASSAGAIQNFSSTTITIDFELTGMSTGAIGYPVQYNGQLSLTSEL